MTADKPRRLGRGLEALIQSAPAGTAAPERGALQRIPVAEIRPNPFQPRRDFRPEELAELEASLRSSGMLQPVTVRPARSASGYELIAGERRLRAATRLGWADVPALVRDVDDRTLLTLALVENLQRADLNPIEEAEGYRRLIDEFKLTQQQIAEAVGKDRTTVANLLRVLGLPATVRRMLQEGELTLGQARPLMALGDERRIVDLAREIATQGLTAREVERRVMATVPERRRDRAKQPRPSRGEHSAEARRIEEQIRSYLQTDVRVSLSGPERGAIEISFYSADDLERLLDLMLGSHRQAT